MGLAISPAATRLYVVNSDFDLQYNGGTLQAYDLERVRSLAPRECETDEDCDADQACDTEPSEANSGIPSHWCVPTSGPFLGHPCGPWGAASPAARWIQPGRCGFVDPASPQDGGDPLLVDAVGIGAFATDVIYRSRPPADDGTERPGGKLFIPVRGDATLHVVEADDDAKGTRTGFELECGQAGNRGKCDAAHRVGDNPDQENTRGLRMPPEPYGIDASADGRAMLVTHQTEGAVALFVNDWDAGELGQTQLEFALGGLAPKPVGVAAIPVPAAVQESNRMALTEQTELIRYQPGFLVTFRDAALVKLIRYHADSRRLDPINPGRPFVADSGSAAITTNSIGTDSRGI
ncbi:hypothetical protein ACFL5O_05405, partial [Myxococcota bacterium]